MRALALGARGCRFKSYYPDQLPARVAQLAERTLGKGEVIGSVPILGTKLFNTIEAPWCSGNTRDFESRIAGSNPAGVAKHNPQNEGIKRLSRWPNWIRQRISTPPI